MNRHNMKRQKGVATLLIAIVVLITVTLMAIFAAQVSVFDQRMSANEIRYKEAFAQAEAGLDFATQRFSSAFRRNESPITNIEDIIDEATVENLTRPDGEDAEAGEAGFTVEIITCNDPDEALPCDDSGPLGGVCNDPDEALPCNVSGLLGGVALGPAPIFEFVSTAIGADTSGTATVHRQISMVHVLGGGEAPDVPIVVSGAVGTGGNFNVVANPNAGGSGVPVSVWTDDTISVSGSSATCHQQYYTGGQCSNPSGNLENISHGTNPSVDLTSHTAIMPDLLPNDPNFPDDLFRFVFGIDHENWAIKRAEADSYGQVVNNCTDISAAGVNAGANFPLWWINGECSFTGGAEIGSIERPVILVIDDNALKTTGGGKIYGIVYLFDNPSTGGQPSAQLGGGPEIFGSLISDVGGAAMQGNFSIVYTPALQESFSGETGGGINFTMAYIPGSWRDFD